jgi:hypothetical protein
MSSLTLVRRTGLDSEWPGLVRSTICMLKQ